tara:strand:- start:10 stop:111 length:102 start_codon:yes stop_codon:yes gene_type:complete
MEEDLLEGFLEELGLDEFEIEQEIENYNQTDRE